MNIPKYVPTNHVEKWKSINTMYGGNEKGIIAANSWLKRELTKPVQVRQTLKFDVDTSQGFIKRSDDGEDYISLVLNTVDMHKDGKQFPEDMLKKWVSQVNTEGIIGDIDHKEYDKLLMSGMTDEQVRFALKNKPGIAKAVKAIYQEGKLWIRALIDKRYRKAIEASKGVSSEAFISYGESGNILDGDLLGFTFNINTEPAQYGVGLAS